ncbi:hypothetical protein JDV02_004249 [Purpureocillium takamizusanense]|uniref:Uncharacterized protein n=1 Tax=Purpureocillium takamizusanense TaxID=2060973 RepID=A0A9Q8VAJ8_9HYPO|nr:uncharacterized protein JDV02_004249 [Purpureocillium takamizusanense]UNI17944.1 hypothetical protein JDV02_004249 [Purpureocillium takamizusanense]
MEPMLMADAWALGAAGLAGVGVGQPSPLPAPSSNQAGKPPGSRRIQSGEADCRQGGRGPSLLDTTFFETYRRLYDDSPSAERRADASFSRHGGRTCPLYHDGQVND